MLIEIGVLSVILSAPARRCQAGEGLLSLDSTEGKVMLVADRSKEPDLLLSQSLESALAADFGTVPEVSHVSVERAEGNLLVWIAVDNPRKDVREKIFDKQYSIIDGFPEVEFDFNLIAARGRAPQDFVSTGKLIYSR